MMSQTPDHHERTTREALKILEQKRLGRWEGGQIGLVVQGGGMRGVYSMGVLAALEEMGFGQCFDHVAGSSAGALNGAYFITGQASYGVETYIHYLSQREFVNPLRFKKMVDIDYLVDQIGKKVRPLDINKLLSADTTLHISLTQFSNGHTRFVTNRTPGIDLWEAFRASAAMPILYNKPVKVGDGLYVDGSLRARVPIRRVIDYGCRYIVVVLTRPPSHRTKHKKAWVRSLSWPATRRYSDGLRNALFSEDMDYNATKANLMRRIPRISGCSSEVVVISPRSRTNLVSTITRDPRQLMRCALQARVDTWNAFGKMPPPIDNPFATSF